MSEEFKDEKVDAALTEEPVTPVEEEVVETEETVTPVEEETVETEETIAPVEEDDVVMHESNVPVERYDTFERGKYTFTSGQVAALNHLGLRTQGQVYSLIRELGYEKLLTALNHYTSEPVDAEKVVDLNDFAIRVGRNAGRGTDGHVHDVDSDLNPLDRPASESVANAIEESKGTLVHAEVPNVKEEFKGKYELTYAEYMACQKLGWTDAYKIVSAIQRLGEEKFHLGLIPFLNPEDKANTTRVTIVENKDAETKPEEVPEEKPEEVPSEEKPIEEVPSEAPVSDEGEPESR